MTRYNNISIVSVNKLIVNYYKSDVIHESYFMLVLGLLLLLFSLFIPKVQ